MTDAENKNDNSPIVEVNNTVNVMGENFDKAAAEMLKATLQMPATETSGLLADIIGVFGDRVKVYRAERRVMILGDARDRLSARGVSLDQSKPMLEGQVYDMIEGMGSAHTSELAEMWAGLMANAMDPNSAISADQDIAKIIQALSANDARLLTFLAAVEKQMTWEGKQHSELMKHYQHGMDGDVLENFNRIKDEIEIKVKPKVTELVSLYEEMGISQIQKDQFPLRNLWNLGLIEHITRRQREAIELPYDSRDDQAMGVAVSQIANQLKIIDDEFSVKDFGSDVITSIQRGKVVVHGRLSEFGRHFVSACGIWESDVS